MATVHFEGLNQSFFSPFFWAMLIIIKLILGFLEIVNHILASLDTAR